MMKWIKRKSRAFFVLNQEDNSALASKILIVDNGYGRIQQVAPAIKKAREDFPEAQITVLAPEGRKGLLESAAFGINFITPPREQPPSRYSLARAMFRERVNGYDHIVLFSLDISPIIASLLFMKARVFLCNQWGQWWSVKPRRISELLKVTYVRPNRPFSLKNIIKEIGLFFVLLEHKEEGTLARSVLIVDNGYALDGQIVSLIGRIKTILPKARITLLSQAERAEAGAKFPDVEFNEASVWRLSGLRHRYDYVILLALDILPVFLSSVFSGAKVILYNRWCQWWGLRLKSPADYLKSLLEWAANFLIFIYLLIYAVFISLRRMYNILRWG